MGILKDLYNGEIYPLEDIDPKDKEYKNTCERIEKLRVYFEKKMPSGDREKFKEWNQLQHDFVYMEDFENFSYGFRLGIALGFEIWGGYEASEKE